jgi:hypothetical protein
MANSIIGTSVSDFLSTTPIGSIDDAIGNNIYGINHLQTPNVLPHNKDNYGLVFFTRPQLNMQTQNLRNSRIFTPLLTTNTNSIQTIIRSYLDPRLGRTGVSKENTVICKLVDPLDAFIPILTNNIISLSGFPDMASPINKTKEGQYGEVHSMVDGHVSTFGAPSFSVNFRNIKGDPIFALFKYWIEYMSAVFDNTLVPYPDMIVANEIDYNTRIYRLILDPSKKFVTKIACTGASFPASLPTGSYFDFNSEKPYNDSNYEIPVTFEVNGVRMNDPIIVRDFNEIVSIFNPSMLDARRTNVENGQRVSGEMVKLSDVMKPYFNHRGYPRIDPFTYELEWWVLKADYEARVGYLVKNKFI